MVSTGARLPSPEEGAATVLVLAALLAVVLVLGGGLVAVVAVRESHRARSVADLAVLAAAGPTTAGGPADCRRARRVAGTAGARVVECRRLPDGSVLVRVRVPVRWPPGWSGLPPAVEARARAGTMPAEGRSPRPGASAAQAGSVPSRWREASGVVVPGSVDGVGASDIGAVLSVPSLGVDGSCVRAVVSTPGPRSPSPSPSP